MDESQAPQEHAIELALLHELLTPHVSAPVAELSWEFTRLRLLDMANKQRLAHLEGINAALRNALEQQAGELTAAQAALRDATAQREALEQQAAALQQQLAEACGEVAADAEPPRLVHINETPVALPVPPEPTDTALDVMFANAVPQNGGRHRR